MSGEGTSTALELTRRLFAAANASDYDAILDWFGPESVWDVSKWGLGSHSGLVAIRHSLEGWMGGFDEYEVVLEELTDLGHGVIFAVATQYGRAAGSGRVELRYAPVFLWREGFLAVVTHYRDIAEGRAAAEALAHSLERKREAGFQATARPPHGGLGEA
jgi:ketosteroid isomerase-like protein